MSGLIGTFTETNHPGCDAIGACRHLTCGRCEQHTDNGNQGHYWAYCSVTKTVRDFHFCCPGDCELGEKS